MIRKNKGKYFKDQYKHSMWESETKIPVQKTFKVPNATVFELRSIEVNKKKIKAKI